MKTQEIHKAVRNIFKTDDDLMNIFAGRLSNTRLPSGLPRPYVVIRVLNEATEVYTGGSIVDYKLRLKIYTTEGLRAAEIADVVDTLFTLVQNLIVADANVISCIPTTEVDKIEDDTDLGQDVLLNELNWDLKLFEPTRETV
ncbi:MAG: DUF3168 domain-containing protein [Candidatus Izemoplasmatales bacterium]|jgi:hypothetical protein